MTPEEREINVDARLAEMRAKGLIGNQNAGESPQAPAEPQENGKQRKPRADAGLPKATAPRPLKPGEILVAQIITKDVAYDMVRELSEAGRFDEAHSLLDQIAKHAGRE